MKIEAELYAFVRQGPDVIWHGPVGGTYDAFHPCWTATGRKIADGLSRAGVNVNGEADVSIDLQGKMVMRWTD